MNIRSLAVVVISAFLLTGVAFAADTGSKIGFINLQKILVDSKAGKEAKAAFDKDLESKKALLKSKEEQVSKLENDMKKMSKRTKPADRKAKEEELAKEIKELRRMRQDLAEDLKKKDADLTSRLLKDILDTARKVGEEKGYTAVIQGTPQVIYIDKTADLTDEVLKRYDSQYKGR